MITVAGYRIGELLDEGCRTALYDALRTADQTPVLIKVLRPEQQTTENIEALRHEKELIARLRLEGLIGGCALETSDSSAALVMDHFGGVPLSRLMSRGSMTLGAVLALARDVAGILGELHKRRIIHKNISPSSILIDPGTNRVRLIDVGLPPLLQDGHGSPLCGSLLYCSPEQTGRMNRAVDFRTDFYSLGVTLHKLLTGDVPFSSDDPLQLIHSHIAREPADPASLNPAIPRPVADIVLKLLAKNAEDRYQSAYGLQKDLETCLAQLQTPGGIQSFELGSRDALPALTLPDRLYGRERESGMLREAFERVKQGGTELLLVAGGAGIGKTALINELRGTALAQHGWFLYGKYDQLKKNVPYSSIIFAFKQLISRILGESEGIVQLWKERLLEALPVNGQLIIDVIPEVKLIIGEQPPIAPAGPAESQNRFNRVVQRFVGVFVRPEHPLVLFLDDLQWIDPASLNLIRLLLNDSGLNHLLIVGAFRSNDVTPGHPLQLLLDGISGTTSVTRIDLEPLTEEHTIAMICDALRCPADKAASLARIIHYKTSGNPFFMNQMLTLFYEEKLLVYEPGAGWRWSIEEIARLDVTDNIVDLLVGKIGKLAPETRELLTLASCIGNRFDLTTLAFVLRRPADRILQDLGPAVEEGLVIPSQENFLFFHDRIQEAVYSLFSAEEKTAFHYRIGKLVLASTPDEQLQAKVFYIADQLNAGSGGMTDQSDRLRLAELNLMAGRKAKASSAHAAAEKYLSTGLELLAPGSWQTLPVLTRDLFLACAECTYVLGDFERAERLFELVLANTPDRREKADVYRIRVPLALIWGHSDEAIELGRKGLQLMGFGLPPDPGPGAVMLEFLKIRWLLGRRSAEDLLKLPEMNDPGQLTITQLLIEMAPAAYFGHKNLFTLILMKVFTITIQSGQTKSASTAYAAFALVLAAAVGDYGRGLEFSELAVRFSRQHDDLSLQAQCDFIAGGFVSHWKNHLDRSSDVLIHGHRSGLEAGNFIIGGYCAGVDTFVRFARGDRLDEVQNSAEQYLKVVREFRHEDMIAAISLFRQAVLALKRAGRGYSDLSSEGFDEQEFRAGLERDERIFILCLYHTVKLPLHYLFEEYDAALASAEYLQRNRDHILGMYYLPHNNFYHSLALASSYQAAAPRDRHSFRKLLRSNQRAMKRWAEHCPANFANKYLLVEAERARLKGRFAEAQDLYAQSVRAALENHLVHEAGIANELAGQFHLAHGREKIARGYLEEALLCYRVWGAAAKVEHVERRHARVLQRLPDSRSERPAPRSDAAPAAVSPALDLATVLKLSQAISREISLDRLLPELMKIAIESAGARRGHLLLERDGRMLLEARGAIDTGEFTLLPSLPFEGSGVLAESIVNYTARTRQPVVLNNAVRDGMFTHDPAIRVHSVLSVLCAPIVSKGRLIGILYLDNDLASHAFTPERFEVLNALSSQIAFSLENARLYDEARKATESLEESEQKFRALAETVRSGIVIYRDERFLYVNPATERITGYSRAEFASMTFGDIIHPGFLPLVRQRAADRMTGKPVPAQYEFKIVHKNGEERWMISTAGRIRYGREEALIATLLDITEQKAAEQERLRLFEENERQYQERIDEELRHQREKENILMDIHDGIGGIITNIGLLSQVAQKASSPEAAQKALATITRLAREGNVEIHSLMFSLDSRDHTWRSLAAELRNHGEKLLAPHEIAFTMDAAMEEAVGQQQPHALLFLHIFRIYREALNNVIKHARATAVAVTLRLTPDGLALAISDDGVGFDPEAVSGKGRGVNNMKVRAAEVGGSISIATGKGATVSLTIPFSGNAGR